MNKKLILALIAAVPVAAQATDGYFANGYGMKSIAMGGAAVAVAEEPFGGAVNPGAMSFLDNQWQLGLAWFSPDRNASRSGSGPANIDGYVDSGSKNFFVPEFGINWKYSPDVALGLTVYGNGGMNTDYAGGQISEQSACSAFRGGQGAPYNLLCGSGDLGVDLTQLIIAPYASWQFTKGHSIGIAPLIAYQRFKAEGLQAFDNPAFSSSPGSVTNNGYSDAWGAGVRVGYMGQFTPQFAFGAAYSTKISMGDFGDYKGLFAEGGGFDIPSSFTVGLALRPTPQWLIALDFERIFYDDTPSVNNPSAWIGYCPPPPMGPGQSQYCLGGSSGAGFGWQNVDVWKIGVQVDVNERWTLRGGFNHTDNPIEPQDVTINILAPGVVQDQWSLGTTYRIDKVSEITGAFMYAQNNSLTGPSLLIGFGLPPTTTETIAMKQYLLGIAYSRKF
ncbi:MAG: outer membrane protein transport protein [Burkholderiales bacterium]|nr:outer membrane protein transport protein [Burkholderiales bacterium]